MTSRPRTRLERVHASVGSASLALQQIEPDRDGDASCLLGEAADLITDHAGQRLIWAARALAPQGESA